MNDVRNYGLIAIAGHLVNAPNNTSREDPTGAEGSQGIAPAAASHLPRRPHRRGGVAGVNSVSELLASQTVWPIKPMSAIFHRGGLHCGRHTTPNRDLTATKRGELRCEKCAFELGPRRGRQQTGGIAPLEVRHAGDTPKGGF